TPDTALSSPPRPTSGAASLAAATAAGAHARRSAGTNPRVYNAFDRRAQLWVAATLYQTAAQVYERVFGKLGEVEAVEVYRGFGVLGTALQVPAELWPRDLAAFELYWNTALTELHVTDDARRVAHDLLHPRTAPLWLRAAMPLVRLLTAGLLPPELRRAFVLPWSARDQRRFDRIFAALALVYPRLPLSVRHFPRDLYLRRLRASL
ncbi:oxygenase MpaB family protein, partial [Subtercola vilae]|uniref:oxygenase MpaB family protein n=2 Tax=Subtercola TaxID=120212 RepID=UPI0010A999A1